jgi:anti-sigma factor RsiW
VSAVSARKLQRCIDVEPLLDASVDGELIGEDAASVDAHVSDCPSCRAKRDARVHMKAALAAAGAQLALPDEVEARIVSGIRTVRRAERRTTAAIVAVAVIVGVVGVVALNNAKGAPSEPPVISAALQRHQIDLPVDVASPDPERVAAFLKDRIGHPVLVPRLSQAGWGLEGGRVIEVADRPAAQLVYRSGLGTKISVIAIPDPDGNLARQQLGPRHSVVAERAVVFARSGALYSIVGDLPAERLESASYEFAR